jgi:hypothetical protein
METISKGVFGGGGFKGLDVSALFQGDDKIVAV